MLVLFDSPAGHCLFKVLDTGILKSPDSIWDSFTSVESAKKTCAVHLVCVCILCARGVPCVRGGA